MREAWERGQALTVHGWVYHVATARLRDLDIGVKGGECFHLAMFDFTNGRLICCVWELVGIAAHSLHSRPSSVATSESGDSAIEDEDSSVDDEELSKLDLKEDDETK